jgi:hypothetical protein
MSAPPNLSDNERLGQDTNPLATRASAPDQAMPPHRVLALTLI